MSAGTVSPLDAAHSYVERRWAVVPIPHGEKAPRISGWPSLRLNEADLPSRFSDGANIGVILGTPSGGVVDVDLDCTEAIAAADFFLPHSDFVFGRASKPRSHRFYVCDKDNPLARPKPQKFCAPDGGTLVELRADGQQTIVPPSLHPSGELYEFFGNGNPALVSGDVLQRAVSRVAAAALLARVWPVEGRRNDCANALAGMLLRGGWSEDDIARFVEAACDAAHDEETRQRIRDVTSTAKRIFAGRTATGTPTLAGIVGDEVVVRVREWLRLSERAQISTVSKSTADGLEDSTVSAWPEPLAPEAFCGIGGEFVHAIEPHSESDPAALLLQFLVSFGNLIGRGPRFLVERHFHYTNLFCLIVGQTSRGRKGTAWAQVREIFSLIDPVWASTRIHGGIGSGEGIVSKVQDPILKGEKLIEEGSSDKRLLLLESEFAQILAVVKREGGTTSEVLRRGWDGTTLQTLVKHSPAIATGAIVSLVGHITKDELLRHLDQTEIANGLMNRFLFCCARRSKCLPDGGSFSTEQTDPLVEKLRGAVEFARKTEKMNRDEGARTLWRTIYPKLTEDRAGLFGAIISRSEAQVLRLSMIFALLDSSAIIRAEHLIAALAVWQFCEESARHIFGDSLGDPVADEILRALRATPGGLTRNEVREMFGRNKSSDEISRAVGVLLRFGLAKIHTEGTSGRPAQRLTARHVGYAVNAVNAER